MTSTTEVVGWALDDNGAFLAYLDTCTDAGGRGWSTIPEIVGDVP